MAFIAYSTMVGELAPHVSGCPTAVIESYIRKVVIDLCNRAQIYRTQLADVTLLAGIHAYPLVSPVAQTEVVSVLSATMTYTSSAKTLPLQLFTDDYVRNAWPQWPDLTNLAPPQGIFQVGPDAFHTTPVPDALDTYVIHLTATLRPTMASTGWEDTLFNEFRRAIFHGVLHELMLMPERNWFNKDMAGYHGKQWDFLLNSARARATKGFGRASVSVQNRPWA